MVATYINIAISAANAAVIGSAYQYFLRPNVEDLTYSIIFAESIAFSSLALAVIFRGEFFMFVWDNFRFLFA
ncbi:hypothetical protein FPHYL_10051 [Fusarium phyllophilum]|uniref:Uncharacterized protein n=1 Tax=Fusarium phyllophilum TaxID=47803 RepID=A0A8H5J5N0_9HYPO|nr:hypothetical protein FPHYL_10051 [Fusarium phyllophilum]